MSNRLNGKVCIITGSTSGIGRGVAKLFAKEGGKVVITGRRAEKGQQVVDEIVADGGDAIFIQTDMMSEESIRNCVAKTAEHYGTVDVVVGNAGAGTGPFDFDKLDVKEHFEKPFDLLLKANWIITAAALPYMLEKNNGAFIYTSSIAGEHSASGAVAYAAAKAGLESTAKSLAVKYGDRNIRFNCVVSGTIASEMSFPDSPITKISVGNTAMRRCGLPEEIAHVYLLMATDECPFMTGACVPVNGGLVTSEMPFDMEIDGSVTADQA